LPGRRGRFDANQSSQRAGIEDANSPPRCSDSYRAIPARIQLHEFLFHGPKRNPVTLAPYSSSESFTVSETLRGNISGATSAFELPECRVHIASDFREYRNRPSSTGFGPLRVERQGGSGGDRGSGLQSHALSEAPLQRTSFAAGGEPVLSAPQADAK